MLIKLKDLKKLGKFFSLPTLLLAAEESFLIEPSKGNLNNIYNFCKEFDENTLNYFLEYQPEDGTVISNHYKSRFNNKNKFDLKSKDISYVFNRNGCSEEGRFNLLADIITRGEQKESILNKIYFPNRHYGEIEDFGRISGFSEKSFWDLVGKYENSFKKNKKYIENSFSMTNRNDFMKKLTGESFERILTESGVKERFPVKYSI